MSPGAPRDRARPEGKAAKTQRERNEARRREKLQDIEDRVRDGSLVIRQMTPEERESTRTRPLKPPKS